MSHVVVIADAPEADLTPIRTLLEAADLRIAADGGAKRCLDAGVAPDLVVGDFDSLSEAVLNDLAVRGTTLHRFRSTKDETDLELALLAAVERGATSITILAALGGRPDMHLANHLLLAHPALEAVPTVIREGGWSIRLMREGTLEITGHAGRRVSLIPLGAALGITTTGLRYALTNEPLQPGPARGVSNELLAEHATIQLVAGMLLVFVED